MSLVDKFTSSNLTPPFCSLSLLSHFNSCLIKPDRNQNGEGKQGWNKKVSNLQAPSKHLFLGTRKCTGVSLGIHDYDTRSNLPQNVERYTFWQYLIIIATLCLNHSEETESLHLSR